MVIIDSRERIMAAVQADHLFKGYEIEMTPAEAVAFAEIAPLAGVPSIAQFAQLIRNVNAAIPPVNFGPEHPQTGKPHHTYGVGRHGGQRILTVSLFKGFFKTDFDFMGLVETIHVYGREAGAQVAVETDNNTYSIMMRWTGEAEAAR